MTVKSRTLYITVAITLLALVYYITEEWFQYSMNVELLHKEQIQIVETYYDNFPMRTAAMLAASSKFISSDIEVRKAFRSGDTERLGSLVSRYFSYMDSVFARSGVLINFISPDGTALYRAHAPNISGDDLTQRGMVKQVLETRKAVSGIEMGRFGVYLRNIQPVADIGFIECGVHISFFAKRMDNIAGIKTLILLDTKYASLFRGMLPSIGDTTQYYNNTGLPILEFMTKYREEKKGYVQIGDKNFDIVKEFNLIDYKGEKIGEYIFFAERSILHAWFKTHTIIVIILGLLGIVFIIFVVRNGFMKSIAELEEEHTKVMGELKIINAELEDRIQDELQHSREKDQIINQQQKVADMGQMLSAVSHHWRQPINAIGLYVQDILDAYHAGELNEQYLKEFEENNMALLNNLSDSIDMYKSFYKPTQGDCEILVPDVICDIGQLIDSNLQAERIVLLFAADCTDKSFDYRKLTQIDKCECKSLLVRGPINEFKQSLLNIILNAVDAIRERMLSEELRGQIRIKISEDDENVFIRIANNGVDIKEEDMDRIFNPFFSTKDEGKGQGLGLYMSKTIIEKYMGGSLTAESSDNETAFSIRLPKI